MATQRIEVITGREARRHYTDEEKLRLVEAAFGPGVKTAEFARIGGICQTRLHELLPWEWKALREAQQAA